MKTKYRKVFKNETLSNKTDEFSFDEKKWTVVKQLSGYSANEKIFNNVKFRRKVIISK